MSNNDFLLDIFQEKQKNTPLYNADDTFLAISDKEIGQEVELSSPVSASTSVEQAFIQERQKLNIHLD